MTAGVHFIIPFVDVFELHYFIAFICILTAAVMAAAIAYEKSDSDAAKTYINILVVKEGNENNEGLQELAKVLKSDEIKDYINNTYDGAVVPFEE